MSHAGRLIVLVWTLTALVIVLATFVAWLFAMWSQPATTPGAGFTREFYVVTGVGVAFDVALVLVVAFVTRRR
jgi:polyferredoxin